MGGWTAEQLERIDAAQELMIAVRATEGGLRPALPIWTVVADGEVLVRTWYRRRTGWYGRALSSGRARIAVPGLSADVTVDDVGDARRESVDAAYRRKYRTGADRMVSDEAAATTLRLRPEG